MLNIIQNTIGAIRRVGESVVRAGLKMWLPFTKAEIGASNQTTPDTSSNDNNAILKTGKALQFTGNDSVQTSFPSSYTIKTIAFWINPTHSSTNETVFFGGGAFSGVRELYLDHLQVEAANGTINMSTYVNGTLEGVTYGGTPATLTQDEWQRVVLTSSTGFTVVSNTFDIASGLYGSDGRFIMSDLQIYDETWTTDDIAYDYANPQNLVTDSEDTSITLDNLKAWWHLSEGDGTIAFDSAPLLGVEEITNGNFESDSDWTIIDGGWTISNNEACHTGSASFIEQNTNLISGRTYKVVWTISSHTNQSAGISSNSGTRSGDFVKSAEGTYVAYLVSNGNNFRFFSTGDNCIGSVSVKEVYNIDGETYDGSSLGASYVDAQERIPQLGMMNWGKGSNLLEYSEDFSEWSNVNSGTGSQVVLTENQLAPDGTLSATKMFFDKGTGSSTTDFSILQTSFTSQSNTASVYLRSDTAQKIMIRNSSTFQLIDVSTDWVRINKTDSGGSIQIGLRSGYVSGEPNTSTIYVWGAQVESGTTASAYRRTNGSAVTDATLISSATDSQKDILGNAVRVKGSGFNLDGTGYAEVLDDNDFDIPQDGAFTFMGWSKFKFVSTGSGLNVVYANGGLSTATDTFSINTNSSNKVVAYVGGTFTEALDSSFDKTEGDWVFFAITRNAGSDIKFYLNKVDTDGVEKPMLARTRSNNSSLTNANVKYIGRDSGATRFYKERIDDLILYNTELSLDDITQNYNATKSGHNN